MVAPSKLVLDRTKSADAVIAAAHTHEARIGKAVKVKMGAGVDGATSTLLRGAAKVLETCRDALLAADERNNVERSDDEGVRKARDQRAAAVRDKLMNDRRRLGGIVVEEDYVKRLGFEGLTPEQPDTVLELARVVQHRLKDVPAPTSSLPGYHFDPVKWAEDYEPLIAQLDKAIERVGTEVREAEATLVDKKRAVAEFDETFSACATLVSALLSMGGEKELAARVRPSARRAGLTAEVAADPEVPAVTLADEPVPA